MSTTATVTVTLAIQLQQGWGDDCTVQQIRKQAQDDGRAIVQKLFTTSTVKVASFHLDGVNISIPTRGK